MKRSFFLEINSTQTNARSDLKQSINLILNPLSEESIAASVLYALDKSSGPLHGLVERYWFDENKLKTTSIVSFALKPLVKFSGEDTLFTRWPESDKDVLVKDNRLDLLDGYIGFSTDRINEFLIAARKGLPPGVWSANRKEGGILTTTTVKCLLICYRLLIDAKKDMGESYYTDRLKNLSTEDLTGFHSSRYRAAAEALYTKYFS